jgi:hypothetical protein
MNSKSIDALFFAAAIIAGLIVSWFDLHANEVQPAVLLLLVFGAVLGFARSRSAWRWAIVLGLSFFLGDMILPAFGIKPIDPVQSNALATLIGLIPSFIGTYAGVVARKVTESLSTKTY